MAENNDNSPKEGAVSWQAGYSRLENQYALALSADNLYGCYTRNGKVLLDNINKETLSVNGTLELPDASFLSGMAADREGNVYLLEAKEEGAGLWRVDADGSLQDYIELQLEDTDDAEELFLKGIDTDPNGYFYVWCEMQVPEIEIIENMELEVWHYVDRVYVKYRVHG